MVLDVALDIEQRILRFDHVEQLLLSLLLFSIVLSVLLFHLSQIVEVCPPRQLVTAIFELLASLFAAFDHCLLSNGLSGQALEAAEVSCTS